MPTWTQEADFEENDLTDFNSTVTTGSGALAADAAAALAGSFGLKVTIAEGDTAYGKLTGTLNQTAHTLEFKIDPNGLTMANGDLFEILFGIGSGTGSVPYAAQLGRASGQYYLNVYVYNDAATPIFVVNGFAISDAPHTIRYTWKQSSGGDDGIAAVYVDGILIGLNTDVDNDGHDVDEVWAGAAGGVDAGTSGSFYMDDIRYYNGTEYLTAIATLTATGSASASATRSRMILGTIKRRKFQSTSKVL